MMHFNGRNKIPKKSLMVKSCARLSEQDHTKKSQEPNTKSAILRVIAQITIFLPDHRSLKCLIFVDLDFFYLISYFFHSRQHTPSMLVVFCLVVCIECTAGVTVTIIKQRFFVCDFFFLFSFVIICRKQKLC